MTAATPRAVFLLLWLCGLTACAGVETGTVSPCHGQFRAEGKYFTQRETSDGTRIVVSTMNGSATDCTG